MTMRDVLHDLEACVETHDVSMAHSWERKVGFELNHDKARKVLTDYLAELKLLQTAEVEK